MSPRAMLIAAILLLIAGFGLGALALFQMGGSMVPPQAHQQGNNQGKPNDQDRTTNPPKSENKKKESSYRARIKEYIKQKWNRIVEISEHNDKAIVAISTIFIAAFTIVLAFATAALFISSEKVADAARISADATRDSVELAEQTAQRQLRAYVIYDGMRFYTVGKKKGDELLWHIYPIWRNAGNTPARKSVMNVRWQFGDLVEPTPTDFSMTTPPTGVTIGQGQQKDGIPFEPATGLTGSMLNDIRDKKKRLFLFAIVTYQDIFGKDHVTMTCGNVTLSPIEDFNIYKKDGGEVPGTLLHFAKYNCEDGDCDVYAAFLSGVRRP